MISINQKLQTEKMNMSKLKKYVLQINFMSITPEKYTNIHLFFIFVRIRTGKFMNRTCEQTKFNGFFYKTLEINFLSKKTGSFKL